jgi:hypothetical protein
MIKNLEYLLHKLDSKVNPERQDEIFERHRRALSWEETDRIPLIVSYPYPKSNILQPYPHHEVLQNPEKMLFNELVYAFDTSILLHEELRDDLPLTIRANFGTVVIASIFGGKVEQLEDNPPWVKHFETLEEFKTIFDRSPLDFSQGYVREVIDTYRYFNQVLSGYSNLKEHLKIVLPDLQGPLDSLELLRGSNIYSDFVLDPELVNKGLILMTKAQIGLAKHLHQFTSDASPGFAHQHATMIKGNILIRNDSAIMISPEMYSEQVASHDEFVLNEMNGGGIHSCGRIDFNVPEIFRLHSIKCFDFGQSYLNDLDIIYPLARQKGIPLIRISADRNELLSGKIKKRFPTGVSLVFNASSFEEAKFITEAYRNH